MEGMEASMSYTDAFFVMLVIGGLFWAGYGLVMLLGLMVVKVWDRTKKKNRWHIVRR